jgi:MbtH protein
MESEENDDKAVHLVLVNEEEQYSLWLKDNAIPNRWTSVKEGTKAECLQYVKEVLTDMRPLSLRKHKEEVQRRQSSWSSSRFPYDAWCGRH